MDLLRKGFMTLSNLGKELLLEARCRSALCAHSSGRHLCFSNLTLLVSSTVLSHWGQGALELCSPSREVLTAPALYQLKSLDLLPLAFYLTTDEQQPAGYSSAEAGEVKEGFDPCLPVARVSTPKVLSQQRGRGVNKHRDWTDPLYLEVIL